MLNTNRKQPAGFQLKRVAVTINGPDHAVLNPWNIFIKTRNRETTFLHFLKLAVENVHFGVNEHPWLTLVFGQVHNNDLPVHVDLGGRKANAGRIVHGLEHVVDQLAGLVGYLVHRLGDGAQSGIRVFENI